MRFLITGGSGYIGSNLVKELIKDNDNDINLIIRPHSDLKQLNDIKADCNLHYYHGDINDIIEIFKKTSPEIVIHLASYTSFLHSYKNIDNIINSNILFGTHILEAMVLTSAPYFINTGTYWQHYNESSNYSPNCLYAATKQSFQDILKYYTDSNLIKSITLKLFDTYGPNDSRKKIFTILSEASLENNKLAMTSGEQLIDLVYITDVINAYLKAIKHILKDNNLSNDEIFFVSSGNQIKLKLLVEKYLKISKKKIDIDWGKKSHRPREIMNPIKEVHHVPGWEPKIVLEQGLKLISNQE